MNIFALDADTKKCAQYHNSKHCIKMQLEHMQILCTNKRLLDNIQGDHEILYKVTHKNHPSTIWARQNADNYFWLIELTYELHKEYTYRYGKIHLCEQKGMLDWLVQNPPSRWENANSKFTLPTPAMDDEYKVKGDVIASYRNYYNKAKAHLADWGKREIPDWFLLSVQEKQ